MEGEKFTSAKVVQFAVAIIGVVTTVVVGSIAYGRVTAQGDRNTLDIAKMQELMRDVPTRNEFNDVKGSVSRIETGVNELRSYLLKK